MTENNKEILANFLAKNYDENTKDLDTYITLEDIFNLHYEDYRIKFGFSEAAKRGYTAIINHLLEE